MPFIVTESEYLNSIKVGSTIVAATVPGDQVEFVAGDNITLSPSSVDKKITINSLGAGGGVFGSNFSYAESLSAVTRTGGEWESKVSLSVTDLISASYRLGWSFAWNCDSTNHDLKARILMDSSIEKMRFKNSPAKSSIDGGGTGYPPGASTDRRAYASGFIYLPSLSGNHTFDFQWASSDAGKAVSLWDVRLEFWRVS